MRMTVARVAERGGKFKRAAERSTCPIWASRLAMLSAAVLAAFAVMAPPAQATFPGRNGPIAFAQNILLGVSSQDIWVINPNGSHEHRVSGPGYEPSFSADGRHIVFTGFNHQGVAEIYVVEANGRHRRQLTRSSGTIQNDEPSFSPNGRQIVFQRANSQGLKSSAEQIFIMSSSGRNQRQLSHGVAGAANPSFSPNGRKIVFGGLVQSATGGPAFLHRIFLMNANGSHVRELASRAQAQDPSFSPDGRRILFEGFDASGVGQIFVMSTNGTHVRQLTHRTNGALYPAFSPDGRRIVFAAFAGDTYRLFVMNANGSHQAQLTPSGDDGDWQASWGPQPR